MNCLVIGFGSIGARHANILKRMGHNVSIVSKRKIPDFACTKTLKDVLTNQAFEYTVISNETYKHFESYIELRDHGYSGKILIEKPVFNKFHSLSTNLTNNVYVAYNLRFHPIIQKIRTHLHEKKIYSIQVYVGQYLPDWRPNTEYSTCYSASKNKGGGVLRDLSHELDYLTWLCGGWNRVAAIGGKYSSLNIDSDDCFGMLIEMHNCPVVSVQMNYLDRKARREVLINLENATLKADLIQNTLEMNNEIEKFDIDKDCTYTMQHKSIIDGDSTDVCTLNQGLDVLNLIGASELAVRKKIWINRFEVEAGW
jgi:predicted dehydrogenase